MPRFTGALSLPEQSSPASQAGRTLIYAQADGKLYAKDDAGTVYDLTAGGTSGNTFSNGIVLSPTALGLPAAAGTVNVDSSQMPFASDGSEWYPLLDQIPTRKLRRFRLAYAKRDFAKVVIAGIGDSVMEGQGTTRDSRWMMQWIRNLSSNPAPSFVHAHDFATGLGTRVTFTGTTANNDAFGIGRRAVDLSTGAVATSSFEGTGVDVHYITSFGTGVIEVRVDGVLLANPSTNNGVGYDDGYIIALRNLSPGTHTLTITANGGTVTWEGFKPYNGDEAVGIHLYEGGSSGSMAGNWDSNNFGGPVDFKRWPKAYAAISPHLIVIALGINDRGWNFAPAQLKTNLASIISVLRTNMATQPSFLLVAYPEPSQSNVTYAWEDYVESMRQLTAGDDEIALLDISRAGEKYTESAESYADTIHPNTAGHQLYADFATRIVGLASDAAVPASRTYNVTQDYIVGTPLSPPSGLTVFSRNRARRIPAFVGPTGQDSVLQPALFSNRISRLTALNSVALPETDALAVINLPTTPTAIATASTNFYTGLVRTRYTSAATAGSSAEVRSTTAQWFRSATPNSGGFFFVARFGLGAATATNRIFAGLSTGAVLLPNADPTALLNSVGFATNTGRSNMYFMTNDGTGAATAVDLGVNFPTTVASTYFYEVRLFAPSGDTTSIYWSATRLNDGITANGTATTDLPTVGTLMSAHIWHNNGTTATAVSLDVQSMYIETDN